MKRIVSLILALVICFSISVPAFAAPVGTQEDVGQREKIEKPEPMRPEETRWYYRTTPDGLLQRRLWSITYGYWLTDWITIGYVNPNP